MVFLMPLMHKWKIWVKRIWIPSFAIMLKFMLSKYVTHYAMYSAAFYTLSERTFSNFKQLFLQFWAILGGFGQSFYLIHRVTLIWISFDFKRVAADETFGQFSSFDFNFVPVAPKRCFWGRKNSFMVLTSCCFEAFWSQTSNLDTS